MKENKSMRILGLALLFLCSNGFADTGIGKNTHVEMNFENSTDNYALRCYGSYVRHGDIDKLFKDIEFISIGYNDNDRGRLIKDSSNVQGGVIDSVTISVNYPDYSNSYNISWVQCFVYPSVKVACQDDNYNVSYFDITEETSSNAYPYDSQEVGGPDPQSFAVPAREYDDYTSKSRYDSPVAVIEIGLTPLGGAFYNLVPIYNVKSEYSVTNAYTDMTYKYERFDRSFNCESKGLNPVTWAGPINYDASKINLRLLYEDNRVGSLNDKSTLILEETSGV